MEHTPEISWKRIKDLEDDKAALLSALERVTTIASCAPNDDPDLANQEFKRIMDVARTAILAAKKGD